MDRYLFKAKRVDNGEWIIGNLIQSLTRSWISSEQEDKTRLRSISNTQAQWRAVEVDSSTLCQCTGLKDKNDKLIWENDIIKKDFYTDYDAYANSEAYTGRIHYEDGGWSVERTMSNGSICTSPIIDMIAYSKDIEQFEVIGNIFDNPELYKREKTYYKDESDLER